MRHKTNPLLNYNDAFSVTSSKSRLAVFSDAVKKGSCNFPTQCLISLPKIFSMQQKRQLVEVYCLLLNVFISGQTDFGRNVSRFSKETEAFKKPVKR